MRVFRLLSCLVLLAVGTHARADEPALHAGDTLTLERALELARTHQPALRQARALTEAARGRADVSRAPLLPQVQATAQYQRTTGNFVFRPGANLNRASTVGTDAMGNPLPTPAPPDRTTLYNFYNFGITGTQLIYDFASIDSYRAGKEVSRAQAIAERTTQLGVDYAARTAYFNARATKLSVHVAQTTLDNQNRHREQVEAFVEVGTRPEIDLAQTRTDVANARVALIQAQNNYAMARASLNLAMGVDATLDYEVTEQALSAVPEEHQDTDALLRHAIAGRPDLQMLAAQYQAQRYGLRAAKGQYGPALSAQAAATEAGTDLNDLRWNYNVGLLLSWNFLQGWLTHGNVRVAKANLASTAAQADSLRLQVRLALEQGRLAVQSARAVTEATADALANARIRLQLAEGRYEAGVGNIIELGDAQLALTAAESQRVQAEYNLDVARAQLLNALGKPE